MPSAAPPIPTVSTRHRREAPAPRWLPWVVGVAFGVPAVASAALVRGDGSWGATLLLASLCLVSVLAARTRLGRRGGPWLALATVALCVLWPELALRLAGFSFKPDMVIQFGFPRPHHMVELERDAELFWKLPATHPGVNSLGIIGPEIAIPKPADTFRMAFFGDSCTHQGYPNRVARRLAARLPDEPAIEAMNLGVSGYSAYQGRVLAERWARRLEPDVGVVYFGWNDHWQAYGVTDAERARRPGAALSGHAVALMRHSRLVQLGVKWLTSRPLDRQRVSLDEYREHLLRIGELLESAGATVVLITAPSSHTTVGVPPYLVYAGFARSAEQVVELHERYADVVRDVARERGWVLLDLAAEAEHLESPPEIFKSDGIHFRDLGLEWVAARVVDVVLSGHSPHLLAAAADDLPDAAAATTPGGLPQR